MRLQGLCEQFKVFKKAGRLGISASITYALFPVLQLMLIGCATQASMVDMELEQERIKLQYAEIKEQFKAVGGNLQGGFSGARQEQTDFIIKLDELAAELQTLYGRLEETAYLSADLSQRLDDQTFRMKELVGRLDILDRDMMVVKESVGTLALSALPKVEIEGQAAVVPGLEQPPKKTIILPGRSTQQDKTSQLSPSEAYGLAYNDYLKGNYDLALMGFENFLEQFETTSLAPNAGYWMGESHYGKKDYLKAIEVFQKVTADYPDSNKVPGAILKSGYAYIELRNMESAKVYLKKVIEDYPFSNEAELAKKRLAELD